MIEQTAPRTDTPRVQRTSRKFNNARESYVHAWQWCGALAFLAIFLFIKTQYIAASVATACAILVYAFGVRHQHRTLRQFARRHDISHSAQADAPCACPDKQRSE